MASQKSRTPLTPVATSTNATHRYQIYTQIYTRSRSPQLGATHEPPEEHFAHSHPDKRESLAKSPDPQPEFRERRASPTDLG
ncbi:hypothetical protein ACFX12_033040 [Malus domestica]